MTTAAKLQAVPLSPLASAQQAVARAESALGEATKASIEATKGLDTAAAAHDKGEPDGAAREVQATVVARKAQRLVDARKADLESANQVLREAEQAEARKELSRALTFLSALPARIAPHIRELVNLDRQVGALVDRLADTIVESLDVYARATELGEQLGTPASVQTQAQKPSLGLAALLSRIAIARDREKRKSDLANGWLESATEPRWDSPERPAYDAAISIVAMIEKELV